MNEEMRQMLIEIADRDTWADDEEFSPYDMSGGNFDDAYFAGADDGQTNLARELLKKFGGKDPS